ncbi:MAG: hydrogenase maturation nickel metallochaperone HypA [Marinilabiliales bacterium]|nr:MAG: hydrogenase maturation nickel metallochaperone HypA [Marinilabiliales bacterium]
MHEMSIAESIIEIAEEYAAKENAKVVTELDLSIGTLAGIEFESLEFALETCKNGTILQNTIINIDKVKAKAKCFDCNLEFEVEHLFDACPHCKSYSTQLLCGKEMQVKSLLVD